MRCSHDWSRTISGLIVNSEASSKPASRYSSSRPPGLRMGVRGEHSPRDVQGTSKVGLAGAIRNSYHGQPRGQRSAGDALNDKKSCSQIDRTNTP